MEKRAIGIGDEIMASGRAKRAHEETGQEVILADCHGRPRWHPMWENIPFLANQEAEIIDPGNNGKPTTFFMIKDAPGCRPYIERVSQGRCFFRRSHRPTPGCIVFSPEEIAVALELLRKGVSNYVVLEPHVKGTNSADNKDWGWHNWLALERELVADGVPIVQFRYENRPVLPMATVIPSLSFREVVACIASACCVVTSEGGYHHAAAAVGTKAVVIWGGFTSPEFLGYSGQANIYHEHKDSPCGRVRPCAHCRSRMQEITVSEVHDRVMEEIT